MRYNNESGSSGCYGVWPSFRKWFIALKRDASHLYLGAIKRKALTLTAI